MPTHLYPIQQAELTLLLYFTAHFIPPLGISYLLRHKLTLERTPTHVANRLRKLKSEHDICDPENTDALDPYKTGRCLAGVVRDAARFEEVIEFGEEEEKLVALAFERTGVEEPDLRSLRLPDGVMNEVVFAYYFPEYEYP